MRGKTNRRPDARPPACERSRSSASSHTSGPWPAPAFDVDTHYLRTYCLSLHDGFTKRQANQIASGTFAIDHDAQTGPMEAGAADTLLSADRVMSLSPEQKVALDIAHNLAVQYFSADPHHVVSAASQRLGPLWWLAGLDSTELTGDSFTPRIQKL